MANSSKCGNEVDNAKELQAWNAWKDVCWVHGVGKSIDGRPPVGTKEDESILKSKIARAFRKRLAPFMQVLESVDSRQDPLADVDFAQEFDAALAAYEASETPGHYRYAKGHFGDPKYIRKAKAWKESVWDAVAASKDPPIKVIRGKLIGDKGVIRQVVEEWLQANYSCRFNGNMLVFDRSRDEAPFEVVNADGAEEAGMEENEMTVVASISPGCKDEPYAGDEVAASESSDGELITVPAEWVSELERMLPPRICCMLYAKIMGLKIYDDAEVLGALGIGKSTAAAELARLREKCEESLGILNQELVDWIINDAAGKEFLLKWVKKRCESEKAWPLILSRVAAMRADR